MPIKIGKRKPKLEGTNQSLEAGEISLEAVTISMPQTLKMRIDSRLQKNVKGEPYGRSKYIVTILKQHMKQESETDPRYKLARRREELRILRKDFKSQEIALLNRIEVLSKEAEQKNLELLKK